MSKTIIIAAAIASIVGLSASLPAHAATRSVGITVERFADRCAEQGGVLLDANPSFGCQTPATEIECSFSDLNTAHCEWAGIDNQIAVNRIIGSPDASALNQGSADDAAAGKGGKGGGFKNNLPLKW